MSGKGERRGTRVEQEARRTKFAELLAEGVPAPEAFVVAYPDYDGKNRYQLIRQWRDSAAVQQIVAEKQTLDLQDFKTATLAAAKRFLAEDFDSLKPADKGRILPQLMDRAGLSAAKEVNVNRRDELVVDVNALVDQLESLSSKNPEIEAAVAGLLATPIDCEVIEVEDTQEAERINE